MLPRSAALIALLVTESEGVLTSACAQKFAVDLRELLL